MKYNIKDILRKGFDEFAQFVNPLIAERARIAGEPINFVKAENGQLIDNKGNIYEDFHGCQALGHRNHAITKAVREFLDTDSPSWYPSRVNPFAGRLAKELCNRTGYSQVYFGCTGSEAVEASIKLARVVTKRAKILSLEGAYHGCTYGSLALMNEGAFRNPFGPHIPNIKAIPFACIDSLKSEFLKGDVAAVVVEPIQGEGGIRPLPQDFVDELCKITLENNSLIIADEIQTSLGRSGHFIATSKWKRKPDVLLMGKALGGGLVPLSATLTHANLFEKAYGIHYEAAESHNSTFSNNAVGCVAGLAALDIITDDLVNHISEIGREFRENIYNNLKGSPLFKEVRGDGLMIGIELNRLDNPWLSFEHFGYPEFANRVSTALLLCSRLYKRGFYSFICGHNWSVIRLQPRFDISKERLVEYTKVCRDELDFLYNQN
ncbi:MAG: aspartate aminotransferase family protein [Spirochaetota bacterium]|nr:aspartate aminotransferase family protein [Spirochaetota bacterium]